jgi:transposase InsO family protein
VAPNLLEQNFTADAPDQKWVSDITSIWTEEGWLYLAVVLELYSRRVIGWAIAERMTATLVCDALIMALYPQGTSGATTCLKGSLSIRIGVASIALPPTRSFSPNTN